MIFTISKTMNIKGYTLCEMLMVISVMTIFSVFLMRGYTAFQQRVKADLAIMRLYQAIISARSDAVRYNSHVALCPFDRVGQRCQEEWKDLLLIFRDDNGEGILQQKEQIIRLISFHHSGIVIWKNFRQKKYLEFLPEGGTSYLNGTFLYCPIGR